MRRPTIADVAREAGVGVATVDRVINGRARVSPETVQRVLAAAEAIGFRAAGLIRLRQQEQAASRTLGFLLQKRSVPFYQALGAALTDATREATSIRGRALVEYLDVLTPERVAERLLDIGARADAVAVVAADHPKVNEAIARLHAQGVPTFALLSDLGAPERAGFVGVDPRKAGRSAAWMVARLARRPGKVAIFIGNHRYIGHEICEMSFRSYCREHAPELQLLEPLASLEESALAQEATLNLLKRYPDLVGLYVAGGGTEGVIAALREHGGHAQVVTVCSELHAETRAALIDGIVDVVIATPLPLLARRTVEAMAKSLQGATPEAQAPLLLPFDWYIAENV